MKPKLLLVILLLFSLSIVAQNFSGEIEYKISFIAKNNKANIDSLKLAHPGNRSIYLIKNGYYKNSFFKNDTFSYSYTYENITKRMYDQRVGKDYLSFRDSRKANMDKSSSIVYKDSTSTILGKNCFLVVYENVNSVSKTYYTKRLKLDPDSFENHKIGNWYDKIKEVDGCIGLKTITEYDDYLMIAEAININKRSVNRKEFALPLDKLIIASYSTLDKNIEMISPSQDQLNCYFDKIKSALQERPISEPFTTHISIIVTKNGELKNLEPVEKDEHGFYKVAIDILKTCGIKFNPGQIDNNAVSSLTYFPITFE